MADNERTSVLEFLFLGPLFSINKTLQRILEQLQDIRKGLKHMATQADVDALAAKVVGISEQQSKAHGEVVSEFEKLREELANSDASVDLSGLSAAIDNAGAGAQQLDDLVADVVPPPVTDPTPPVNPVVPPTEPIPPSSPGEPAPQPEPETPAEEDDSEASDES